MLILWLIISIHQINGKMGLLRFSDNFSNILCKCWHCNEEICRNQLPSAFLNLISSYSLKQMFVNRCICTRKLLTHFFRSLWNCCIQHKRLRKSADVIESNLFSSPLSLYRSASSSWRLSWASWTPEEKDQVNSWISFTVFLIFESYLLLLPRRYSPEWALASLLFRGFRNNDCFTGWGC
jgi:hypothetical protein